jgi:LCP family protein required for cell wall assembly
MSTVEEELRAAFARHEPTAPAAAPVRQKIDFAWVRAKRRRARRRTAGLAAAVLLAAAAVPTVLLDLWRHGDKAAVVVAESAGPALSGPFDVLLIGSDRRERWAEDRGRADTVMLLHVPADGEEAFMISLPRDGAVSVGGNRLKLSETFYLGGAEQTRRVVEKLTGVDVDATVTVDFRALRAVTKAVGGVTMCLEQAIPPSGGRIGLPAGCQRIGEKEVGPLLQARWGLENGGYDRDRNNQQFLRALTAKVTADGGTSDLTRLRTLLAATDGVQIDGMDPLDLLRVAASLGSPDLIGISSPSFNPAGPRSSQESIYPKVGPALYRAIRDDQLAQWASANPAYVQR